MCEMSPGFAGYVERQAIIREPQWHEGRPESVFITAAAPGPSVTVAAKFRQASWGRKLSRVLMRKKP